VKDIDYGRGVENYYIKLLYIFNFYKLERKFENTIVRANKLCCIFYRICKNHLSMLFYYKLYVTI